MGHPSDGRRLFPLRIRFIVGTGPAQANLKLLYYTLYHLI